VPLRRSAVVAIAGLALVSVDAAAQAYPSKVVRIVTSAPGSTTDILSRIAAKDLQPALGQPFIVENRGGPGAEYVARAAPDGHTILFYGSSVWVLPIFQKMSYDPVTDLAPVSRAWHRRSSFRTAHGAKGSGIQFDVEHV
jgi:tripartite-type tricarboxylate transporter receptor subunit TctC